MKIDLSVENGERLYQILLFREDFDDLCSGCPDGGFIVGRHKEVYFHIFDGNRFSDAWRPLSDGYFMNIGVEAPVPSPGASKEEWDRSAEQFYSRLEQSINESGKIPIEDEISIGTGTIKINLGHVIMNVEPPQK